MADANVRKLIDAKEVEGVGQTRQSDAPMSNFPVSVGPSPSSNASHDVACRHDFNFAWSNELELQLESKLNLSLRYYC